MIECISDFEMQQTMDGTLRAASGTFISCGQQKWTLKKNCFLTWIKRIKNKSRCHE